MADKDKDTELLNAVELDSLFDAVGQEQSPPSAAFLARLHADMDAHLPHPAPQETALPLPRKSWIASILEQIGGVPAAAGLATAGVVGLAIGGIDPARLDTAAAYLGLEVVAYDVDDLFATFPTLSEDG